MGGDIGWTGLAASTVLVGVAVALSLVRRLSLERSILWASLRAVVQLLAVGVALDVVLRRDLAWSWAWVAVMALFAAETVRRRAAEVPGLFGLSLAAFVAAGVVSLAVLFGLGIFDLRPATLIPLSGMTIGNSMTASVVVARRVLEELRDKRDEVEARLALALPGAEAVRPYVRAALRTALIPQIETTRAVGLVFLPGAMTGLILAGTPPLEAVKVQAAVMYLILGATAATTAVIALGVSRRLLTADHRLQLPPRRA